ncbi:hypothetical protein BHE74_00019591 [Ensete ventricosum]|nr:hypothetical protein GW17_00011898 [Ensete ventricosum]RWW72590.1 hypothetical protein BHE74_00019591 [Ensete ventricosum]RZR88017.1 hypothetical protein BHM03_00015516 [Ensete ventricosum]
MEARRCKKGKLKQNTAPTIEEGEGDLEMRRRYGLPAEKERAGGVQGSRTSNVWALDDLCGPAHQERIRAPYGIVPFADRGAREWLLH